MESPEMRRVLRSNYDEVLARLPEALQSEGFGILTEIDVHQTLKQKLGVDFRRYMILGACNPALAHEALKRQLEIGVMMPCNVVVYEADDNTTVVIAIDPTLTIGDRHRNLGALAESVRDKLGRALDRLAEPVASSPGPRT